MGPSPQGQGQAGVWGERALGCPQQCSGRKLRQRGALSPRALGLGHSPSAPVGAVSLPALGTYLSAKRVD